MRTIPSSAVAALLLVAVAAAGVAIGSSPLLSAAPTSGTEVRRIQSHFDSVLVELTTTPTTALDALQRARREQLIGELRAYRDRAVFPHNYDFPGQAVPYFVDRKTGTLCAVANLLDVTGRRDIVDRVARADNNVYVMQLAGDTAFAGWLRANGLTLVEAARIQIPYIGDRPPNNSTQPSSSNRSFNVAATISAGSSVLSTAWNATINSDGHQRIGNVVGLVSGMATMALGATTIGKSGVPSAVPATSMAIGGVGVALSTRSFMRHRDLANARRTDERTRISEATVSPTIQAGGGAGINVALRF